MIAQARPAGWKKTNEDGPIDRDELNGLLSALSAGLRREEGEMMR